MIRTNHNNFILVLFLIAMISTVDCAVSLNLTRNFRLSFSLKMFYKEKGFLKKGRRKKSPRDKGFI